MGRAWTEQSVTHWGFGDLSADPPLEKLWQRFAPYLPFVDLEASWSLSLPA